MRRRWLGLMLLVAVVAGAGAASASEAPAPDAPDVRMEQMMAGVEKAYQTRGRMEDVQVFLRSKGVRRIQVLAPARLETSTSVDATSEKENVQFDYPVAYFDDYIDRWVVYARWVWKSDSWGRPLWMSDMPWACGDKQVGGPNAAGLWFEKTTGLYFRGFSLHTYDQTGVRRTNQNVADDWNEHGVAFVDQDYVYTSSCFDSLKYGWHEGYVWTSWEETAGTPWVRTAVKLRLGHTWSSTSVSSVSVGLSDISVGFDAEDNKWNGTSPPHYWEY